MKKSQNTSRRKKQRKESETITELITLTQDMFSLLEYLAEADNLALEDEILNFYRRKVKNFPLEVVAEIKVSIID